MSFRRCGAVGRVEDERAERRSSACQRVVEEGHPAKLLRGVADDGGGDCATPQRLESVVVALDEAGQETSARR